MSINMTTITTRIPNVYPQDIQEVQETKMDSIKSDPIEKIITKVEQREFIGVDNIISELYSLYPKSMPKRYEDNIFEKESNRVYYLVNVGFVLNKETAAAQAMRKIIDGQINNPAIDEIVNKRIDDFVREKNLHVNAVRSSAVKIDFYLDNKNNLTIHQSVKYNECIANQAKDFVSETHDAIIGNTPCVKLDLVMKVIPNGNILTLKENALRIEFNGESNELRSIFNKQSLWEIICDYFMRLFSVHPGDIVVDLDDPLYSEYHEDIVKDPVVPITKKSTVEKHKPYIPNSHYYTDQDVLFKETQGDIYRKYMDVINKL